MNHNFFSLWDAPKLPQQWFFMCADSAKVELCRVLIFPHNIIIVSSKTFVNSFDLLNSAGEVSSALKWSLKQCRLRNQHTPAWRVWQSRQGSRRRLWISKAPPHYLLAQLWISTSWNWHSQLALVVFSLATTQVNNYACLHTLDSLLTPGWQLSLERSLELLNHF